MRVVLLAGLLVQIGRINPTPEETVCSFGSQFRRNDRGLQKSALCYISRHMILFYFRTYSTVTRNGYFIVQMNRVLQIFQLLQWLLRCVTPGSDEVSCMEGNAFRQGDLRTAGNIFLATGAIETHQAVLMRAVVAARLLVSAARRSRPSRVRQPPIPGPQIKLLIAPAITLNSKLADRTSDQVPSEKIWMGCCVAGCVEIWRL